MKIRIQNIQRAILCGKQVKMFDVYKLKNDGTAYEWDGRWTAPAKTPNKNLKDVYFENYLED